MKSKLYILARLFFPLVSFYSLIIGFLGSVVIDLFWPKCVDKDKDTFRNLITDKALDLYYCLIGIVALMKHIDSQIIYFLAGLIIYRFLGLVIFIATKSRRVFIIFPNFIEYYLAFIILYLNIVTQNNSFLFIGILISSFIIIPLQLAHEVAVHLFNFDFLASSSWNKLNNFIKNDNKDILNFVKDNLLLFILDNIRTLLSRRTVVYYKIPPHHYLNYVEEGKNPIILIQGHGQKWNNMVRIGNHVSLQGHPVHVVSKLGENLYDIPYSAQLVRDHIESENLTGCILLAHSKGGLIGKYLLAHLNSDNRIRGMVAIASPFNGTAIAGLVSSAHELKPGSEVVIDLQRHREVNSKIISIFPKRDDMVWHEKGSYLEGALDNIQINDFGHSRLIFSKKGKEAVIEAIKLLSGR